MGHHYTRDRLMLEKVPIGWLWRIHTLKTRTDNVWITALVLWHWRTVTGRDEVRLSAHHFFPL